MFLFVRWYQCVSFSVRIHFSTTCLSNSRKNETYTWKAVHWLWCVSGYQGKEGKSQVLLPMPTVAIQSCRLHADESNILFLPIFFSFHSSRSLFTWYISFIRNPNQICSRCKKKPGVFIRITMKIHKIVTKSYIPLLSAVLVESFSFFFFGLRVFFLSNVIIYRTCYVFVGYSLSDTQESISWIVLKFW